MDVPSRQFLSTTAYATNSALMPSILSPFTQPCSVIAEFGSQSLITVKYLVGTFYTVTATCLTYSNKLKGMLHRKGKKT